MPVVVPATVTTGAVAVEPVPLGVCVMIAVLVIVVPAADELEISAE